MDEVLIVIFFSISFAAASGSEGSSSTVSSHCFKRISGGERLIGYDVTRIIERNTVGECEEECNVYKCTFFSFGNVTGNGTCELTTDREISRTQDSSFDLYQRTDECVEGKPTGYEKACYRRIITGKRLHERFIRHSLPCNSLQACQHQCSIEKHFTCQGFNIRLDPARVGRGICELSSVLTTHLDLTRDFVFDPEFAYYERDHQNGLPNCGPFNAVPNAIPSHNPEENSIGYRPSTIGGPYYGGDSYGPWSTGHGTVDHGPWGSHGYGSGFYESNNPSRGPAPSFHSDTPFQQGGYGYGYGYGFIGADNPPDGSRPPIPTSPPPPGGDNEFKPPGGPGLFFHPNTPGLPGYGPQSYNGPLSRPNNQPGYGYNYGYGYGYGYEGSYSERPRLPPGNGVQTWGQTPLPGKPKLDQGSSSGRPRWDQDPSSGSPTWGQGLSPGSPTWGQLSPGSSTWGKGSSGKPAWDQGPSPGSPTWGQEPSSGSSTWGKGPSGRPAWDQGSSSGRPTWGQGPVYGKPTWGQSPSPGKPLWGQGPSSGSPTLGPGPSSGKPLWGQGPSSGRPTWGQGPIYGKPTWGQDPPPNYPSWDRKYDKPNRIPTYIIIDAETSSRQPDYQPHRPSAGYLPIKPPVLPLPGPPPRQPPRPPLPPLQPSRPSPPLPPLPPSPPSSYPFPPRGFGMASTGGEVCFRREHPGYKLNPDSIRGMYETPTVLECEAMCIDSPFKCTGYSFRYSSADRGPNCLLTDHTSLNPETHLLPDRSCDVYLKMSTCMELDRMADTECFLKVATNRKLDPSKLVKAVTVSGMSDCELACLSTRFFTCRSFSFRHGPPVIGEPVENCFLSDWPISALTHHDFIPLSNHEVYERGSFGHGCELDAGSPHIGPRPPFTPYPNIPQITHAKDPWGVGETWRHFTVNGWPCRVGTECELNPEAGFWACEVEGGDRAQWDYCCRPKHSCGFSRGYNYPWCYVGEAGPDQWRPCSEFYYPDYGSRYSYKPVHPVHPNGPPRDTRPWTFGPEEFGPPSYWPISYIYAEPPPNETYVWDPEQIFYHDHDDQHELHSPEHYPHHHHQSVDGPRIRFKSCGTRRPYPRAIIQKLDLKDIPKAGNPEEESKKGEKSWNSKPEPETKNGTNGRAKEVIKEVEKIIMENSTRTEPEKNESLKEVETKYPAFFGLSLLESPEIWD